MTQVPRRSLANRLAVFLALAAVGAVLAPSFLQGAFLRNYPLSLTQPDGEVVACFATGDEFRHRVHDRNGYTILKSPDAGLYVYAIRDHGQVIPSVFRVGRADPALLGLEKNLEPGPAPDVRASSPRLLASPRRPADIKRAPLTGTLNNLVIFIRFQDEDEFGDDLTLYGSLFDLDTAGFNSMHNYFQDASYNQLSIWTYFFPFPDQLRVLSVKDSHKRSYYQPYDANSNTEGYSGDDELTSREHNLLLGAVEKVDSEVPADLNLDGDNDGYVDNVCFIVRGGPDGWSDLLWPHMWSLYTVTAEIQGKRVSTYNLQLEDSLKYSGVGVLCHEMFHSLGSPDLYHYSGDGLNPVGAWDVMEYDLDPPQHMGAYMKYQYGRWIASIPEITADGTYTLQPLTSATNNCFRIKSPASATEYYVVEYRKRTGTFESSLPGEGLLVYRINPDYYGNADGPPDEVYVYRPDGTPTQDGSVDLANFSLDVGRTAINDGTNPSGFLSSGSPGHLNISQVGAAGDTISFHVSLPPTLVLTAPDKTAWTRGTTRTIAWRKTGPQPATVKLRLYRNKVKVLDIAAGAANAGRFVWKVPDTLAPGPGYQVRIQTADGSLSDTSPGFVIR